MIQGVGMLSQEKVFDDRDEWHLLADELSLLPGMIYTGRPGFALQLKFRLVQGHYRPGKAQSGECPFRHARARASVKRFGRP